MWDKEIEFDPWSNCLVIKNYKNVFVGKHYNKYSCCNYKSSFKGNSILIELKPLNYLFIGDSIKQFTTTEPIVKYVSTIGNNSVPYPFALTENYAYIMLGIHYFNREDIGDIDPYVAYYDHEDNWIEPNHIANYYNAIVPNGLDWCFCLRNIVDQQNEIICKDMCESLGHIHHSFYSNVTYLIDTSCYCIKREVLVKISHVWNKIGTNDDTNPDRIIGIELLENFQNYICTFAFTLNYRTSNRKDSPDGNMFVYENDIIRQTYGKIPWEDKLKVMYVTTSDRDETRLKQILQQIYDGAKITFNKNQYNEGNDLFNGYDQSCEYIFLSANSKYKPLLSSILTIN